jgi:two-component system, cell cycle sensor histidine kinase and response regulator CckA
MARRTWRRRPVMRTVALADPRISAVRGGPGDRDRYGRILAVGMSPQTVARIFEPFFTTKPPGYGTGLGLSTVYGIVTGVGGSLHAESEEGTGTTFRLYFPGTSSSAATLPAAASPATRGHGETILVVDDEPAVLEATARILRQHGYTTLEAGTSEGALFLAASGDVQLLLTDSVLPRMAGATLARQMAKLQPGLVIVYMSGYTNQQTLLETVHAALSEGRD